MFGDLSCVYASRMLQCKPHVLHAMPAKDSIFGHTGQHGSAFLRCSSVSSLCLETFPCSSIEVHSVGLISIHLQKQKSQSSMGGALQILEAGFNRAYSIFRIPCATLLCSAPTLRSLTS